MMLPTPETIANYGIDLRIYKHLLQKQGGVCAICKRTPEQIGKALVIDHRHSCCPTTPACGGCVRGLLCNSCNTGIGFLADDLARVRMAARYLEGRANSRIPDPDWMSLTDLRTGETTYRLLSDKVNIYEGQEEVA